MNPNAISSFSLLPPHPLSLSLALARALNMSRGAVRARRRRQAAAADAGVSAGSVALRYGAIKCVSRLGEGQVCRRSRGR